MGTTPYLRPDLDQEQAYGPSLYVSGSLPNAMPGDAYEGRLQIHNAIGACTVEQISGATLPIGHQLYVDQSTMEIVVAWPAYTQDDAPIDNPGFEQGMLSWSAGAGWEVTTDNPIAGSRSARYRAGFNGSSIISNVARYPVNPGVPISAQCQVKQGASSAGNAGAGVRIEWRNAAGQVVGFDDGNMVMSAWDDDVFPSNVEAMPPDDAATANIACHGLRKRERRGLWVDSFSWDHYVPTAGINIETTLCIDLRVRDSAGRTALWSGCINIIALNVMSLLHFDGPNASTTITDQRPNVWTAYGNAHINTSQSVFGGASLRCDGNGDYVSTPALQTIADEEAFTIQFRLRLASTSGWQLLAALGKARSSTIPGLLINYNHSGSPGKLQVAINNTQLGGLTSLEANRWYSVAIVRRPGDHASAHVAIFLDGVRDTAWAAVDWQEIDLVSQASYIGCCPPYGGATIALNGWIDEFRIVKGQALFTGDSYDVETAPFPNP